MALGQQLSPTQALVTFCKWAERNGYAVGEMHGFSKVHDVHAPNSWHFDKEGRFGKAADINKNTGQERRELTLAVERAQELGLAVIYARDGTAGPASGHRNHLHVDVGPFSHLGVTSFTPRGGGDTVTAALQRAVRLTEDQVWGALTEKRLSAVRAASNLHGVTFPHGVTVAQQTVGAPQTGVWDDASRAAHDRTTSAIRVALGLAPGTIWDQATDKAYLRARDLRFRS